MPLAGKTKAGQVLGKVATLGTSGAISNTADQASLNFIASDVLGYDTNRSLTQGLLETSLSGALFNNIGGHGRNPANADGLKPNFDPEKANPDGKYFHIVQPGSKAPQSPIAASDAPRVESGQFNERESEPHRGLENQQKGQGKKALEAELRKIKPLLEKLGVELRQGQKNQAAIENDKIILKYSPETISGREFIVTREEKGKWREFWGEASRLALGEELIHVAHLLALRKEWLKRDGRPGTFEAYFDADNRRVFLDLQNTVKSAKGESRRHLEQTLLDCFNLYYENSRTGDPLATNTNEAFALMKNEKLSINFTVEFLRQITQLKRQGRLNEEIHATFLSKIGGWVRQAIERVKATLPGAYDGTHGPEVQKALQKIEAELALIDSIAQE
jgi:hypothetical protein